MLARVLRRDSLGPTPFHLPTLLQEPRGSTNPHNKRLSLLQFVSSQSEGSLEVIHSTSLFLLNRLTGSGNLTSESYVEKKAQEREIVLYSRSFYRGILVSLPLFNRPGVAGVVLQTPP